MGARETSLGLEDLRPELVKVVALKVLLGGGVDVSLLVNGIVLAALDRVEKDVCGLLDALEKLVVFGAALSGLLVRVVLEDLLAVGLFDLVLGGLVSVLGDAEDLVMVLAL